MKQLTFRMRIHRSHSPRTPKSLEKHQPTLVVRLARGPFIQQHPPYRAVSCLAHPTEPSTEHQPRVLPGNYSPFGRTIRRTAIRRPFRSPFKTKQPTFRMRGSPFTFTKNTEVVGETPTNAGGAVSTWAIHPAASTLPSGLLFGTSNGTIYGTPTTGTSTALVHSLGEQFGGLIFRRPFRSLFKMKMLTFRTQVHRSHSPRTPKSL